MTNKFKEVIFESLYAEPSRNGLTKPRGIRGKGYKMINMGELFAYGRINNPKMDLVPLNENEIKNTQIQEGDLLFARQSLIASGAGKCSIVLKCPEITTFESHLIRVRLNKKICNPLFYYYYFASQIGTEKTQSLVSQVAAAGIRGSELAKLNVHYIELEYQDKIAKILSNYDDLIENNNKRIKILEEMAQKIYKEWFVDFRFPGHETATFKQTDLGKIPSDWNSKPIGELLEHQIGGGWGNEEQSDKYTESAYVIRGTDIPNGRDGNIQNCPLRYHTKSNIKTRLLQANDIVFEVSGGSKGQPVGRALLLNKNLFNQFNDNVICASFCKLLRTDTKQILPEIVYLHLLNIYNNGKIEKYQTQSTGIINFKFTFFLESEQILVPSNNIQELFKKIIVPIFDEISLLGYKNQTLKQTRDILLPRLISGEIDVENLEIL